MSLTTMDSLDSMRTDENVENDVVLIDVDVRFGVDGIAEAGQLRDFAEL